MDDSDTPQPDPVDREVGRRVKMLRRRGGMTVEALAAAIGIPTAQLSSIEAGDQRMRASLMVRMAKALGVRGPELLPDDSGPSMADGVGKFVLLPPVTGIDEMVEAFARIRSTEARHALLQIARELSAGVPRTNREG